MDKKEHQHNLRYKTLGITMFLVIAASMLFYFILFKTTTLGNILAKVISVLNPIIYGFVIAYLLNPVMVFLEKSFLKFLKKRNKRPGAKFRLVIRIVTVFITVTLAILVVYALIALVLPQLVASIKNIIINYPVYKRNVINFFNTAFSRNESLDATAEETINDLFLRLQDWVQSTLQPKVNDIVTSITSGILGIVIFFKNIFLGLIISVYVLISKETLLARLRRIIFAFFTIPTGNRILRNLRFVDEKFGGFLIGKIIDSAIIGIICYVVTSFMKMPYTLLISVFIGVTNIIPFFGPFIGAVPACILIFVVNPLQMVYFIIFITALQQFDGNFLGPKILGNSVGVSSFMVVVGILIGTGFMGVVGMVISVPLCAILTAYIQSLIIRRMQKKSLPTDIESYHYLQHIDPQTNELIDLPADDADHSLYDRIRHKNSDFRSVDRKLTGHPWDITEEDILQEDAEIYGKKPVDAENENKPDKATDKKAEGITE